MEEQVQGCSPLSTPCANTPAKRTFCLATASGQDSVLLCNRQHLWVETGGQHCSLINSAAHGAPNALQNKFGEQIPHKGNLAQHGDRTSYFSCCNKIPIKAVYRQNGGKGTRARVLDRWLPSIHSHKLGRGEGLCLAFPLLSMGPQPMRWCHPHSGWVSLQLNIFESALVDTPRGMFPW